MIKKFGDDGYGFSDMTIGRMIQFLNDKDPSGFDLGIKNTNLCNTLWEACKEILKK